MPIVFEPARDPRHYRQRFQLSPAEPTALVRPGDHALFVRRPRGQLEVGRESSFFEAASGRWGLIDADPQRDGVFSTPGESAAEHPMTSRCWMRGQRCVVLADALLRPSLLGPHAVRVTRADKQPLNLAGLWSGWRSPHGAYLESFVLLTLPSEDQPGERRAAFLRDGWLDDWLDCPVEEAAAYLRPYNLDKLVRTEARDLEMPVVAGRPNT